MITSFTGEYRWLSNFFPCTIYYDGMEFRSVEHAYQAAKTQDYIYRTHILNAVSAADAKKYGSSIPLRADWESIKLDVMFMLLSQKFNQSPFAERLTATGNQELVEGNYWGDKFWGVHSDGEGQNNLGKMLMKIRNLK